jgi:hypothetical protein
METMTLDDPRPISGRNLQKATRIHGLPAGGHWFWKQIHMLNHIEENGGVSLAWQKTNRKYMYAVYGSQRDLYENLLKLPAGKDPSPLDFSLSSHPSTSVTRRSSHNSNLK